VFFTPVNVDILENSVGCGSGTFSIADHVFFTPVNVISDHVFFTPLNVNTLENKCIF
jgi:hypothetical protein